MKNALQTIIARITRFLDALGEDFNMEFVEDVYCIGRLDALNDLREEGLFA